MDYSECCKYSIRLIAKLKSLDTTNVLDFDLINQAIYWARKYHGDQKRKSGEPFYSHPLEVAYMVADYNLKTDLIVVSILHDIVEDTEVTVEMIQDTFGQRISEMVDRLTRDRPDGSKLSVAEILNNAYKNGDQEVLLIKLIDRLHNIQTIESMGAEKMQKIIYETLVNFITSSITLESLEIEQQLVESCVRYKYGQGHKPKLSSIKSLFPFSNNSSYLPDLFS